MSRVIASLLLSEAAATNTIFDHDINWHPAWAQVGHGAGTGADPMTGCGEYGSSATCYPFDDVPMATGTISYGQCIGNISGKKAGSFDWFTSLQPKSNASDCLSCRCEKDEKSPWSNKSGNWGVLHGYGTEIYRFNQGSVDNLKNQGGPARCLGGHRSSGPGTLEGDDYGQKWLDQSHETVTDQDQNQVKVKSLKFKPSGSASVEEHQVALAFGHGMFAGQCGMCYLIEVNEETRGYKMAGAKNQTRYVALMQIDVRSWSFEMSYQATNWLDPMHTDGNAKSPAFNPSWQKKYEPLEHATFKSTLDTKTRQEANQTTDSNHKSYHCTRPNVRVVDCNEVIKGGELTNGVSEVTPFIWSKTKTGDGAQFDKCPTFEEKTGKKFQQCIDGKCGGDNILI